MLDFFKKLFESTPQKKVELTENLVTDKLSPDLDPKAILADLQPRIEEATTTCISIKTIIATPLKPESSRFGGLPHIPVRQELPKDDNGKPMRLLAQLNFEEIPFLAPNPKEGLLQFYIAGDEIYGLDFENPASQKGWRVFFFEKTDFAPQTNLAKIYENEWEESPLHITPLALEFKLKKDYPSYPAIEYDQSIHPLFKAVENGDYEDFLEDLYIDQMLSTGHKIGGFPYFTQNEIRTSKKEFKEYQLFFQIDSDADKIMWGDVGVANFFIKKEDLEKRDFSKMLYNWDCH